MRQPEISVARLVDAYFASFRKYSDTIPEDRVAALFGKLNLDGMQYRDGAVSGAINSVAGAEGDRNSSLVPATNVLLRADGYTASL